MENAWKAGRTLNLFTDEYRAPMPAAVPARAVWQLLKSGANGILSPEWERKVISLRNRYIARSKASGIKSHD